MPADASDSKDVLVNQLALQVAQRAAIAKNLLNDFGASDGEDSDASRDESTQEANLNIRNSDIVGVGHKAAETDESDLASRQESVATERLRRQLLGKHARPPSGPLNAQGGLIRGPKFAASKPRPHGAQKRAASDDEDEGRSSMGPRKSKTQPTASATKSTSAASTGDGTVVPGPTSQPRKRGTSYLDQVLAERAAKKKRKKKSQNNESES
ncbi:uncharacterized protein HMPREF1541_00863 [Cyphellophora europaea CBS 101466]|uniref:Uncharacterized protein n=1 Tax=Cyphellophora europaea (strain CBS 101466) TaxID=1220924 RepID=W2SD74_CYPE1|nr:uncharacterized protein HMPREF1541_00863 [Cyphellophora europaea CBS 101466]ETN46676.1 hypothetical protein HMPREF1541_00863 [Cyphellophora europaea CBS 101466]